MKVIQYWIIQHSQTRLTALYKILSHENLIFSIKFLLSLILDKILFEHIYVRRNIKIQTL